MTERCLVLDSGALDMMANDSLRRAGLRGLAEAGWTVVIPTVTLAEALTGTRRDAAVDHLVGRKGTTQTDEATARQAGSLRHAVVRTSGRRVPSAVDALVAAHAVMARSTLVVTTDPGDLGRLLANHPDIGIVRPVDLRS